MFSASKTHNVGRVECGKGITTHKKEVRGKGSVLLKKILKECNKRGPLPKI
jgi:hypothetical protein